MPDVCRTCKARIHWAKTPDGKNSPVDFEPVPDGNVMLLSPQEFGLLAVVLSGESLQHARDKGYLLRVSHWATCPDRREWREETDRRRANAELEAPEKIAEQEAAKLGQAGAGW